ncbi:4-coumarate--CoA ligase-like 7 [Cladophialophora carrionii]|uniref:4-coumarate--CoA ligase-like 7 n=1 Tax=Cladophialophora carrionii TaxID=86049 RepID=A0A1C1CWV1_9EURO|nr:4-coumarate--CoA ligase-like 7 [Cladophialophora carrionii]
MVFPATGPVPEIPNKDICSWIFDEPKYDVNKPIFVDATNTSRSISHVQARKIIRQLIAGLHKAGVKRGDCVLIHSFNDIYYPIFFLAITGAGAVFAGSNPGYTPLELRHHVKITNARFLISEPELLEPLLETANETGIPRSHIRIFNTQPSQTIPAGFLSWTELLDHGEQDWVRFDSLATSTTTPAAYFTSSGTTGLPKATITSHRNLIAQHELIYSPTVYKRTYEVINFYPLPMFHAAIAPRCHTSTLKLGETSYVMRRFDLETYLANIEKFKVTELYLVSAMAVAIAMSPLLKKYSLRSIRAGLAGAAPLSKETQAAIRPYLAPDAPFCQVMGMTEASCILTMFPWPEEDVTGSVGRPIPGVDVKLVDDAGADITAYDVAGEMCVRGPTVVSGYLNNPRANAESFDADGFYHTGDIMYCAGHSKLWYVVDRKKELIKVRGFQVAPPEIEAVLLTHPDIVDAAVIGVPAASALDGEAPRAYVVRRPGVSPAELTDRDVYDWVAGKLAKYKRLDGGVQFRDVIPKNASGKILKRILRDEAKKEMAGPKL